MARDLHARHRRDRSRSRRSAPPASTSTRTRRRASPTRCSRRTASTPPSSTGCCRNAPTISACWRRRRRSTASTTSAPRRSTAIFDVAARDHAVHRARRAAPVDRLDQAHAGRRRRDPDRRGARSRQSAQRQEPVRSVCRPRGPTTVARATASTRSACRSGRRSSPPISPRRSRIEPVAIIPFEPQIFGTAANNGQMIAEVSAEPPHRRDVPAAGAAADRARPRSKKAKRRPADAAARQAAEASSAARSGRSVRVRQA